MIDLAKSQTLRAPVHSTVVIRIAGEGKAEITPGAGLKPLPPKQNARADLREERFALEANSEISVKTGFATRHAPDDRGDPRPGSRNRLHGAARSE